MADRYLFEFHTKKSGHTLNEAAKAMGISRSALSRRLNGEIEFRRNEMEAWMQLTGTKNAGPVFFPEKLAEMQDAEMQDAGSNPQGADE